MGLISNDPRWPRWISLYKNIKTDFHLFAKFNLFLLDQISSRNPIFSWPWVLWNFFRLLWIFFRQSHLLWNYRQPKLLGPAFRFGQLTWNSKLMLAGWRFEPITERLQYISLESEHSNRFAFVVASLILKSWKIPMHFRNSRRIHSSHIVENFALGFGVKNRNRFNTIKFVSMDQSLNLKSSTVEGIIGFVHFSQLA